MANENIEQQSRNKRKTPTRILIWQLSYYCKRKFKRIHSCANPSLFLVCVSIFSDVEKILSWHVPNQLIRTVRWTVYMGKRLTGVSMLIIYESLGRGRGLIETRVLHVYQQNYFIRLNLTTVVILYILHSICLNTTIKLRLNLQFLSPTSLPSSQYSTSPSLFPPSSIPDYLHVSFYPHTWW